MLRGVLLAVGVGLAVFVDGRQLVWFGLPWWAAVPVAAGFVLPVLVVWRAPFTVWQVMSLGLVGCELVFGVLLGPGYNDVAWPWPVLGMACFGFVLFMVASRTDRMTAVVAGAVTVLAVLLPAMMIAGTSAFTVGVLSFLTVVLVAWGDSVRVRQAVRRALAVETERGAVLAERARIARDLHDVVAHHISMIAIQAEAAPHRSGDLPPSARLTFTHIRTAARDALRELRQVLGLLRRADGLPRPDLRDLPQLVDSAGRAGLDVRLSLRGARFEPAPDVGVSVYRVVQEALSNAARHAPGSTVDVTVRFAPDRVAVQVVNGTAHGSVPTRLGAGLGLVGMRERVRMLDGVLRVGPCASGGFEVIAEFPARRSG